ncbi:hypothetical protein [Microbacterium sp.]|uniref:hypothetical protein n=1 Tax=Microbacterium sp. TaxID=51671 RepID=UPI0039E5F042
MIPRVPAAAFAAVLAAASLVGCAGEPAALPRPASSPSTPPPVSAAPPTEEPDEAAPAAPTCESIVTEGTVAALTEAGWTPRRKDFVIGDVALPEGILCFWADYSVATDHGQMYGWAPISAADAGAAQSSLLASGWLREDGPDGVYLTEDPRFSLGVDEDGYGMTYLFGDGWVKLADTREGLILVDWAG